MLKKMSISCGPFFDGIDNRKKQFQVQFMAGVQADDKGSPEFSVLCFPFYLIPGISYYLDVCLDIPWPSVVWLAPSSLEGSISKLVW